MSAEAEDVKVAPNTDLTLMLILEDICPICLSELDTGYECNKCGYDANSNIRTVE